MPAEPATALPRPGITAAVTLRTYALAALAAFAWDGAPEGDGWEVRHLRACLAAVCGDTGGWREALPLYLGRPAAEDIPLLGLARELGLSLSESLAVALAAAVEDDLTIGRLVAYLQAPLAGSRPTLGLLASCLAPIATSGASPLELLLNGPAARCGLLSVAAEGGPLPERTVAVPLHLVFALRGSDAVLPGATIGLGGSPEVPLPPSLIAEARRHAAGLASAPRRSLVLRTGSAAEGRAACAAVAAALELRPLFVETDKTAGFGPWCLLRGLLPVFCADLGPGERKLLPALPGYEGPVLALCGPDGSVELSNGAALSWSLAVPPPDERRALWQAALGDGAETAELARELAAHHRHGSGRIAVLGRLTRHRCRLEGRDRPTREDVTAAWSGDGTGLDALAQPLPDPIPDDALVVPAPLRQELRLLLLRCQGRDGLVDGLGVSARARYRPGVRALLVGPSGTGKTLAAGWLATRLGIPLYRVDLAAVTSKYIGETEKNLAQLLARSEQAEVALLFDEADSLFGKRTDIKDSNDRFANAQTNYLLQRLESWDGIALLTSNSRSRFDPAFTRRLDAILDFPLPGPEERLLLWHSHLGQEHRLPAVEISKLAALADLGGGHIRNVVLAAAVLARSEDRPIEHADVLLGLAAEYRKLGKQVPLELKRALVG
jgi:ATPase family protein associated with various cellular activities (AAA)